MALDRTEHSITLESDFMDGGWAATCSCGWAGARRDMMREASADSGAHLITSSPAVQALDRRARQALDREAT